MIMDRLKEIFNKQKELMEKYHPIEEASGIVTSTKVPLDLNDRKGQARVRDLAWRLVEELAEVTNEYQIEQGQVTPAVREEIVDCLHFLVELTLTVGVNEHFFKTDPYTLDSLDTMVKTNSGGTYTTSEALELIIKDLGMMVNTLKNKAWKQKFVETDKDLFYYRLKLLWKDFFIWGSTMEMTAYDYYKGYIGKNQINKERQEMGY